MVSSLVLWEEVILQCYLPLRSVRERVKQGGGGGMDPALEAKADKERAIN